MQAAFEAEGWAVEEQIAPTRQVFNVDSAPISGTLCRDGERRSLYVQNVNGRSYATVALSAQPTARACNAQDPRQSMALGMMSMLTSQSPSLQLPEGTTAADGSNRIGGGGGGSGDTYETSAQIRIAQSAASFVGDLAAQMLEQGWAVDSSWSGTLSKGGRWTKTSADGILYWGTIELVDVGNGIHDLSFRIMISPV
jgi:hypothetical protein